MRREPFKPSNISFFFLTIFFVIFCAGCDKEEELPPNHAKGEIIAITGFCLGDIVVIEVENPKGIGLPGTFPTSQNENQIDYKNAIGVPYFSKMGIAENVPEKVGTHLYFEYRELTEEERNDPELFFSYDGGCLLNIIPPQVEKKVITKIIDYR